MSIRVGLKSTKIVLTEIGKKWFTEHYPKGIVYEYDEDKPFELKSMGADFVEVICPLHIPYRQIPHLHRRGDHFQHDGQRGLGLMLTRITPRCTALDRCQTWI